MNLISYLFLLEAKRVVSQVPDCKADSSSPYSLDDNVHYVSVGKSIPAQ